MYLNIYERGQAYGGPEEGGWWYSCGQVVESSEIKSLTKAQNTVKILNKRFKSTKSDYKMGYGEHDGVDDSGIADDSFIMRGGLWGRSEMRAVIEDTPGEDFPSERPYYE